MNRLSQHVEALIFASEQAISLDDIHAALLETFQVELDMDDVTVAVDDLVERYQDERYSIEVVEISGGYRFMTKGSYHKVIGNHLRLTNKKKLSRAALETLSIIAYRQPLSKSEMEEIRGVNCDYTVKQLLNKELVEIQGRSDGPGRPLLYGTSKKFMDYFGMGSLEDLPKLKEVVPDEDNTIGTTTDDHASI